MAQDLFFVPLNDDVAQDFDRRRVLGILSKGATEPIRCDEWRYPDGSRGEAFGIDDAMEGQPRLEHLGFTRFGGRTLMERVYELADALDVFLAWSDTVEGKPSACVTRSNRLDHLRDDAKAFHFVVARDASHLNLLVKGSTFEENGW